MTSLQIKMRKLKNRLTQRMEVRTDIDLRKASAVYLLCGVYLAVFVLPIIWMVSSTLQKEGALFTKEYIILAPLDHYTLQNYVEVLSMPRFRSYLMNSIIVASGTTILSLFVGVPAAYSLSRFEYKGKGPLVLFYLSARMLPPVLILIPFFAIMFRLGLVNSYLGIIIAHSVIALPIVVWLLKGFFDDIPKSVDEAALMDGCNHVDVMIRILLPLSKPGLAVGAYWAFVQSWNDYLFVSIIGQSDSTRTLAVGLDLFKSLHGTEWDLLLTGASIMLLPVIILFLLLQNWIVQGIRGTGGGV